MTRPITLLLRWVSDPEKLEYLEGDLEEQRAIRSARHGSHAAAWRYAWDALSICLRQSRRRAFLRRLAPLVVILLLAAGVLLRTSRSSPATVLTINASDPAGGFTLEFRNHRVVAATLDGNPVHPTRLLQSGEQLVIVGGDHGRDFHIALKPAGGIKWRARRPPSRD